MALSDRGKDIYNNTITERAIYLIFDALSEAEKETHGPPRETPIQKARALLGLDYQTAVSGVIHNGRDRRRESVCSGCHGVCGVNIYLHNSWWSESPATRTAPPRSGTSAPRAGPPRSYCITLTASDIPSSESAPGARTSGGVRLGRGPRHGRRRATKVKQQRRRRLHCGHSRYRAPLHRSSSIDRSFARHCRILFGRCGLCCSQAGNGGVAQVSFRSVTTTASAAPTRNAS